ncbi:MAG: hypothetical protein IKJ35_09495 [Clostridia bacterium]|nr:hypothetical protein [Clostridia bacterium]
MLGLITEIGVAMLAVFGFCCAVKMLAELLFPSDRIAVAVEIMEEQDARTMDLLLREAQTLSVGKGRGRMVVLISAALMDGTVGLGDTLDEEFAVLIDSYGAECYLIDP